MTSAMRKRMRHGLLWHDHRAPGPTLKQFAAAAFAALVVIVGWLYVAWSDAEAGMIEAQAGQIKAEVALISLLNEGVLVDRDSGMAIKAKIESYGD